MSFTIGLDLGVLPITYQLGILFYSQIIFFFGPLWHYFKQVVFQGKYFLQVNTHKYQGKINFNTLLLYLNILTNLLANNLRLIINQINLFLIGEKVMICLQIGHFSFSMNHIIFLGFELTFLLPFDWIEQPKSFIGCPCCCHVP